MESIEPTSNVAIWEHLHYCPVVISFLIIWYDIGIVAVDFRAFHVYFCQPSGREADGSSVPYTCSPVENPRNPFKPPIGLPEQIRSHISCATLCGPATFLNQDWRNLWLVSFAKRFMP
jgi:hypothetical protein